MEKLAANLLEELNCENVFTIPVFGGIGVSESTVVTWVIMAVLTLLAWLMTRNLKVDHISKRQAAVESAVLWLNGFVEGMIGKRKTVCPVSCHSPCLHRIFECNRTVWIQAADKGYERHSRTCADEHHPDRGIRHTGKRSKEMAEELCRTGSDHYADQHHGGRDPSAVAVHATVW